MERCCRCHKDVNPAEVTMFIGRNHPLPVCPDCAVVISKVFDSKFERNDADEHADAESQRIS